MLKLKKYIFFLLASTTIFLFTACGESTNDISVKDKVVILHSIGITGCLFLENYGNTKLDEQNAVKNMGYTTKSNSVTCETYGKRRTYLDSYNNIDTNIPACAELTFTQIQEAFPSEDLSFYENKDKSCVLSFDLI